MTSSTALIKKRSAEDSALMPPPPPVKRIKRPPKVLTEETYTSALSHIIARDFFPGLLELETQQDFLDALDAGNEQWINEAEKRVREVMATPRRPFYRSASTTPRLNSSSTPQRTPRPLTTPLRSTTPNSLAMTDRKDDGGKDEVDLNLSLSAFQARYTSEDNESFDALIDRQNAKRAEKYAWMWNGNKLPSARQIAQAAHRQKRLASSSGAASQALILRPSQDLDARPAAITSEIPEDPMNGLMFMPADLSEKHPEHKSIAQTAQERSNAAPKSVSYESTRLPIVPSSSTTTTSSSVPASPSLSAIDRAIRGEVSSGPATGANSIALSSAGGDEVEMPNVNGWEFVDAEPTPSELGIATPKHPLLKELGAAAAAASSKGGGFTIAEPRKREMLHHRIVERQLSSKRTTSLGHGGIFSSSNTPASKRRTVDSPAVAAQTPSVQGTPRGRNIGGNLTPAAKQLYSKLQSGRTPLRNGLDGNVWGVDSRDQRAGGSGGKGKDSGSTPFDTSITPKRKKKRSQKDESGTASAEEI